ncbi:protein XRP2-like [Oscarella lobularis]|uniref:protein XRP2-like n=1 Tax=Oscarella lobularis TaxID=121494 RepID=UPI003313C538
MGSLFSRLRTQRPPKEEEKKTYSWDRRERVDPKDFTFDGLEDTTAGKLPGQIGGQQFIIKDCKKCDIYLFDHIASLTIDDCVNCRIVIGPVKGSVFFRDCKDITCLVACQQFRTRDCKKMRVFLHCSTKPIIESSTGMQFGCYQANYPKLEDHFSAAGISLFENNWSNIHDYSPIPGEENWKLIAPDAAGVDEYFSAPSEEPFSSIPVSFSTDNSLVPLTMGLSRRPGESNSCLVILRATADQSKLKAYVKSVQEDTLTLVQIKQTEIPKEDAQRMFPHARGTTPVGPVVVVDVAGNDNAGTQCIDIATKIGVDLLYVSDSAEQGQRDIDTFYNFIDMAMS